MSNLSYLDGIPQAVATIVTGVATSWTSPQSDADLDTLHKRVVGFTDQLTRTIVKALLEAQIGK